MKEFRAVDRVMWSRSTLEGAGVHLKRAFGPAEVPLLDPFLLLDDFHSRNPSDYVAGFPWHPHRGIETVTYMINGTVEHGDSMGNRGAINSGDVQWMTAGSGIVHQEMPLALKGFFQGFQLWVNLPAKQKMMGPRYRGIVASQIPSAVVRRGVDVKVIAGELDGAKGPVKDLVVDAQYLDVSIAAGKDFEHSIPEGMCAFAYVFEGDGHFDNGSDSSVGAEQLVVFKDGPGVRIRGGSSGVRFLLVSGAPLREPVAWGGPIVMNTQRELDIAFEEYWKGTFIKVR